MSEVEVIKLPICFIFSRGQICNDEYSDYYKDLITSFTVGKTKWNIQATWAYHGQFRYIKIHRTCISSLRKLKIDVILYVKRNESPYWRNDFTDWISESQDTLTISPRTSITFQSSDILEGEVIIHDPEFQQISTTPQLSDDFLKILDNNKDTFADAKLKCGTTEIPVHKCILSARSPVFGAMFKNKMQESEHGVAVIEDMEPDDLKAMLKYIYGGKSDHFTDELAEDLLYASDKYQLTELKSTCVEKLKKGTTTNNVIRIIVLGHLLDAGLKAHAMAFVCSFQKITELENTEGWKSLLAERPALAAEVLMAVVKKLQNC